MEVFNMDIGKIKDSIDDVGRKTNGIVDGFAAFHNFERWQVWLGVVVVIVLILLISIVLC
jgi:phage shock protein PspC (stress-responsive transcriptional regulator)